jgi:hypothetical protein
MTQPSNAILRLWYCLAAKIFPVFVMSSASRDISDLNSRRFIDYPQNDKEVRAVGPHSSSREVIMANEADWRAKRISGFVIPSVFVIRASSFSRG